MICPRLEAVQRRPALALSRSVCVATLLAGTACGRIGFDPWGDGGIGQPDGSSADDLVVGVAADASSPDAVLPDLSTSDLSTPDLSTPDLAAADLAAPDLSTVVDGAMPDLVVLDLAPPPDLTAPTCSDGRKNGNETDSDCGGGLCPGCPAGKSCAVAGDCLSGSCAGGRCAAPSCSDAIKNGLETDVDCGGACAACLVGKGCLLGTDCLSGVCSLGKCAAPTCSDKVANSSETDVDCGGGACSACAAHLRCKLRSDCASGLCNGGRCSGVVTVAAAPRALVAGDLNGDGKLDLALSHHARPGGAGVLLGRGDGSFMGEATYAVSQERATGITIGDYNSDGKDDVAICHYAADYSPSNVDVLLNTTGDGTLAAPRSFSTGDDNANAMATGDFDGDGKLDLVIGHNNGSRRLVVLRQEAGPTFPILFNQTGSTTGLMNHRSIHVGDLNGDGRPDIVLGAYGGGFGAFLNQGAFSFTRSAILPSGRYADCYAAIGDLDGDSKLDVVAADAHVSGSLTTFSGRGDGAFLTGSSFPLVAASAVGTLLADLTGDGKLDAVVGSSGTAEIGFLVGKGDGTFDPVRKWDVCGTPFGIVAADLDGDKVLDLAVAGISAACVTVLLSPGK